MALNEARIIELVEQSLLVFNQHYRDYCRGELNTLAYFHLHFFDILRERLNTERVSIQKSTVVSGHIDKTPIATFGINPTLSCELGDLLFVFTNQRTRTNTAILIQCKHNAIGNDNSTEKEKQLYFNWPSFGISRPCCLRKNNYRVRYNTESIWRFMIFYPNDEPTFEVRKLKTLTLDNTFGSFIYSCLMQNQTYGRKFKYHPKYNLANLHCFKTLHRKQAIKELDKPKTKKTDSWNALINHIIKYHSHRVFQRQGIGRRNRINESILSYHNIGEETVAQAIAEDNYESLGFFSTITFTV